MSDQIIQKVEKKYLKSKVPAFKVGDTVSIDTIVRDGERKRIQKFKGLVIAIKGAGLRKMVTLRKISYGIGVEKQLPVHSTNVGEIKVLKSGSVRRSKIYYMRDRIGKAAMKIKAGDPIVVIEHEEEAMPEEVAPVEVVAENTEAPAAEVEVAAEPEAPVEAA